MKRLLVVLCLLVPALACALSFDDTMLSKTPVRAFVYSDFTDATKFASQFDQGSLVYDDGDVSSAHPGNATINGGVVKLLPYNYNFDSGSVEARLIVRLDGSKLWLGDDSYSGSSGSNGFLIDKTVFRGMPYYRAQAYASGVPGAVTLISNFNADDSSPKDDADGYVNIRFQFSSTRAMVSFESSNGSAIIESASAAVLYPSNFTPTFVTGADSYVVLDYYAARIFPAARSF